MSCEDPKVGTCVDQTQDEKAMIALNAGDYDTAQTLLEALIAFEPEEYFRYPRLAATYAAQGGFDITELGQIDQKAAGTESFLDAIGAFLPTPDPNDLGSYREKVSTIEKARGQLIKMPESERTKGETFYGASAALQLTLYQSAYSVMFMNQFAIPDPTTGEIDVEALQSMTIDDAITILNNFRDSVAISQAENPEIAEKITNGLAQIEQAEGATDREKIISFLGKK
ncbi:MAG: hypothetical protein HYW48_03825 [Deltaproteobacteria bacterium]|nr:hypothetical protein [Deltaproteobacteria bacterium]